MRRTASVAALQPVRRQALSEGVFEQLRDRIVSGELPAGVQLPAERELCGAFGVNRGSVREALRRLQQARLVDVRHGGTSRVLDFRRSAGLDLLATMLVGADGNVDARVVRGILEMRSALAPDIARLAARRGGAGAAARIKPVVEAMRAAGEDLPALQTLATEFWSHLVDAADNLAYRLAFNSLCATYECVREPLAQVLASELTDLPAYGAIAAAVRARRGEAAAARARALVQRGEAEIAGALRRLECATEGRR